MSYEWRKVSPERPEAWLARRKLLKRPWHRPPHFSEGSGCYHLTAACYEHRPHIGYSDSRMAEFSEALLAIFAEAPSAWCVLPNHYHLLVRIPHLGKALAELGRLHGRTSFRWNGEEAARGRKVWHAVSDRSMRSEGHFWATVNYIHHNPVKHGYVEKWTEWPCSSATDFLDSEGEESAIQIWRRYPLGDFGKGWDD